MSLDRFSNKQSILDNNGLQRGIIWNNDLLPSLMLDQRIIVPNDNVTVELHVYSVNGDYLVGNVITDYKLSQDKIQIDYAQALTSLNIPRGNFEVVTNIHSNLIGSIEQPVIQVKEISPDRRELLLQLAPLTDELFEEYNGVFDRYQSEYPSAFNSDIVLNFGNDRIYRIINQKTWTTANSLVVRLYNPLSNDIIVNDVLWMAEELADTYIDNVQMNSAANDTTVNTLRGPNFDIADEYNTITETEFKNWTQLLGSNLSTSQQIINSYFSGSLSGLDIGIDYTAFNNFVFYGSATERLANFKYKLQLLEYFNSQLNTLNDANGNDTAFANNITLYNNRKQELLGTFDNFERWLYYEPTSSLTTHGISGSYIGSQGYALTPWPKYLSSSIYYVHATNAVISQNWYNGFIATASLYDQENATALVKTIPQHIRDDQNNSEYELFINMIGQHFDILYTYVNALSKTYHPEEQPRLGMSNEGLYEIASSMGWKLANGRQASSLWQYKLGYNDSGSYTSTSSLFSKSDEQITTEVWRRTVNNLPYLLKTKGTARSIKALMNIYGIPQTLLSIREYGGPHPDAETPALIEDRFAYALHLSGSHTGSVIIPTHAYSTSSIGDWGLGLTSTSGVIAPITRELRFRPTEKRNMMLLSVNSTPLINAAHGSIIAIEYTSSYSGSSEYGRLWHTYNSGSNGSKAISASTAWLPLFDGDIWNLRWWWTGGSTNYNTTTTTNSNTTYYIQVQKASNYITGKIIHSASSSVTPVRQAPNLIWSAVQPDGRSTNYVRLGGASGSTNAIYTNLKNNLNGSLPRFSGDIQEYREWCEQLDQNTFDIHTLNPTSYVSALSATSSYNTLVRHYTLGSDVQAYNHKTELFITSSHPANQIKNFASPIWTYILNTIGFSESTSTTYASASGFPVPSNLERGHYVPIEETYYIDGVSLGGQLPRSQKIRLEDNYLIRRLSPTNTAERSSFDYAPIDNNRVGLFYSQADQVNKDIFDHIGNIALDDYIGDPNDEFDYQYPNLTSFSNQYWKKYTNRNDINAYIRVFSQFDFTLFNQIKQLLPARVDDAMGLLVEPHAIERNKVPLTKRLVIENPQYEVTFNGLQPTASSEIMTEYTGSINTSYIVSANSVYHSGSNGYADTGNTLANIILRDHVVPTEYLVEEVPVDEITNNIDTRYINISQRSNIGLEREINNVGTDVVWTIPNKTQISSVTIVLTASDISSCLLVEYPLFNQSDILYNQLKFTTHVYDITDNESGTIVKYSLYVINKDNTLTEIAENRLFAEYGAGGNINTGDNNDTVYFNNVRIPAFSNIAIGMQYYASNGPCELMISMVELTDIQIEKVYTSAIRPEIDNQTITSGYFKKVFHYSGSINTTDKLLKNAYHATSQSLGLFYSSSLEPANFQNDEILQYINPRYEGCKLVGADINIPTTIAAINNMPVIEVYETNANQLIFTTDVALSNETRQPGNLRIR